MECSVDSLGIGYEKNLCWFDVGMDIEERDVAAIMTTEDESSILTDENGNIYII